MYIESFLKNRLYKHKNVLKTRAKKNAMELDNFMWDQKKKKIDISLDG